MGAISFLLEHDFPFSFAALTIGMIETSVGGSILLPNQLYLTQRQRVNKVKEAGIWSHSPKAVSHYASH